MKIEDLLKRTPESSSYDLNDLFIDFPSADLSELYENIDLSSQFLYSSLNLPDDLINTRLRTDTFKHFNFDYRRFWNIRAVYFDGVPVAILRNAGRSGDDHKSIFIINKGMYLDMIEYLSLLLNELIIKDKIKTLKENDTVKEISVNEDIKDLTNFYGSSLDGYFERY